MNTAVYTNAGAGLRNAAISFGGTPDTNATEEYNGAAWSAGGDLSTARCWLAGAGYLTSTLAFGGHLGGAGCGQTENIIMGYLYYLMTEVHILKHHLKI